MAQAEDTELRDLVIEALEKNGSLAKIRALLRANIFLSFEEECDNIKQNGNLDSILKLPEGIVSLSIVHEFLEFCNLKNTLFVYKSESRQGKEYNYEGKKMLNEKLKFDKQDFKEPILITLLKSYNRTKIIEQDNENYNKVGKHGDINYKDDENCTYIVHEDSQSSTTSNSQSDNSSDEKNKLHLRLNLDHSDTDTSSDSTREKTSSEYIPSEHIIQNVNENAGTKVPQVTSTHLNKNNCIESTELKQPPISQDRNMITSSSDSTSYVDIKPYNVLDTKLLNTTGLPSEEKEDISPSLSQYVKNNIHSKVDSVSPPSLSSTPSLSLKNENKNVPESEKKSPQESAKSNADTAEYSLDFTSSPLSRQKDAPDKQTQKSELIKDSGRSPNKDLSVETQHQSSQSSQSSVSISDVADLISEKSFSFGRHTKTSKSTDRFKLNNTKNAIKKSDSSHSKILSDDSGDFTDSPIPSLSNLSLDIHSD